LPLLVSRVLLWTSMAARLEPIKGTITNWSFFVVTYTIVGLNQELFLHPLKAPSPIGAFLSSLIPSWG